MSSDVLEINVGGRIFTTRRSTLQFERESMLYKLFDENSLFGTLPPDASGRPFIDTDGDTFALILDYLRRGGRLVGASLLSEDTVAKLRADSTYFGLTNLLDALDKAEAEKQAKEEAAAKLRRTAKEYRSIILGPFEEDLRKEYMDLTRLNNLCQDGWKVAHATFLFQKETYMGANMPRVGGFYYGLMLERETTVSR